MRLNFSRRLIHALICALAFATVAGVWELERKDYLDASLTSWEYRFRDWIAVHGRTEPPDRRLLFLGLDDNTVGFSRVDMETLYSTIAAGSSERHALNLFTTGFPFSREIYALVAERLLAAGARGVVFDVRLPTPGPGDEIFRATVERHPDRILIGSDFSLQDFGSGRSALSLILPTDTVVPKASSESPSVGFTNFWPGVNGVIRDACYWRTLEQLHGFPAPPAVTPSTPAALATRAAHWLGPVNLAHPFRSHPFRFSGPPGTFNPISLYEIFVPKYWKHNFGSGVRVRDKVVLIGAAGNWDLDIYPTPFGQMPGPEIQLQSLNALIHHAFLHVWPDWTFVLLIALACLVAWLLTVFVARIWLRVAAFAVVFVAFLLALKLAYDDASTVVPGIPPMLAFAICGLVTFVYDFARETLEKLRVRRTFESYVSREVVRDILDNPASYLNALGGQRAKCALIMTDLRGFTTMSEEMESQELVKQLNEYLSLMVEDIFALRGSVDKFIGDAILAVWGHLNSRGQRAMSGTRSKQSCACRKACANSMPIGPSADCAISKWARA